MSKESKAIKLGFLNEEEMQLYHDICCCSKVFPSSGQELETYPENYGSRRIDFDEYIKENNLQELFEKVRTMSPLNRFIEIYIYYMNGLSMSKEFIKMYGVNLKKAEEMTDGDEMEKCMEMMEKLIDKSIQCLGNILYIRRAVEKRLPNQIKEFYQVIIPIEKTL